MPFRPRLRYFVWILAAFLIFKIYMVREIVAAFVLFAAVFGIIALVAGTAWVVQFLGVRMMASSEAWVRGLRPAGARGALAFAEIARKTQRPPTTTAL